MQHFRQVEENVFDVPFIFYFFLESPYLRTMSRLSLDPWAHFS